MATRSSKWGSGRRSDSSGSSSSFDNTGNKSGESLVGIKSMVGVTGGSRLWRRRRSTRPPSSSAQALLFGALYVYVAVLYVYFAFGFAFLNRYLTVEDNKGASNGGGGGGGGSLRSYIGNPRSDQKIDASSPSNLATTRMDPGAHPEAHIELADATAMPTRAVPLVVTRDAHGAWHPHAHLVNASMTTIRQHFFDDSHAAFPDVAAGNARKREVLGVVRITKTGSTSLLSFLSASNAAHTFDNSLKVDRTLKVVGDRVVPYCFYEPHTTTEGSAKYPNSHGQCGHRTYAKMVSTLVGQLRDYRDPDEGGGNPSSQPPLQLSLSMITVIRDPFDRMLSFFRYFREIYPDWAPMYKSQPQVLQTLTDGDFVGFLRELALLPDHEWTRRYQYEYFGVTVDEAIQVVEEVRVLPLLNECFNASMLLLAHQYPSLFPSNQPEATNRFLESGNSHSRKTGDADAAASLHPDLKVQREFDRDSVRAEARKSWLKDEYRFYDASKVVLGRMLQQAASAPASIVDATLVRQCLDRLDLSVKPPSSNVAAVA